MYSYFVMWRDSTHNLIRINICTGERQSDIDYEDLVELIEKRCKELRQPCDLPEGTRISVFLDPSHTDPVIWSKDVPKGAVKLAGEFPGRHIYSPEWRKQ